jgi:hypothetical protein
MFISFAQQYPSGKATDGRREQLPKTSLLPRTITDAKYEVVEEVHPIVQRLNGGEEIPAGGWRGGEEIPAGGWRGGEEIPPGGWR